MAILNAFLLSLIASLATGLGGALVAFGGKLNRPMYDSLLGFAAGIMTAIATLGLIGKALAQESTLISILGVALGAVVLFAFDRFLPHEHVTFHSVSTSFKVVYRRGLMIFAAMTLHNVPEGFSMGTSYIADPQLGLALAIAIALHNIPEGIAVAIPFRARWT